MTKKEDVRQPELPHHMLKSAFVRTFSEKRHPNVALPPMRKTQYLEKYIVSFGDRVQSRNTSERKPTPEIARPRGPSIVSHVKWIPNYPAAMQRCTELASAQIECVLRHAKYAQGLLVVRCKPFCIIIPRLPYLRSALHNDDIFFPE